MTKTVVMIQTAMLARLTSDNLPAGHPDKDKLDKLFNDFSHGEIKGDGTPEYSIISNN